MRTASWAWAGVALLAGCGGAAGPDARLSQSIGDTAHGRQLIRRYACAACHSIPGIRAPGGRIGPPLRGLAGRDYIAGRLPNTPSNLVEWLRDPPSIDPGTAMPVLGLSDADARDVAAYLYSIR